MDDLNEHITLTDSAFGWLIKSRIHDLYVITGFDEPPSGQSVGSEIGEYYESEINHGRLYPNLNALVDHGLVEKGQIDRRTNYYALTDAGEQALRDRREWESQYLDE